MKQGIIEPGIYRMESTKYHGIPAASKTFLHDLLTRTPAHAITPRKETPALKEGTAIHCAVFEPSRFQDEYIQKPDGMSFSTKDGKVWREEAEKTGKIILNYDFYENCTLMSKAVHDHLQAHEDPIIKNLLTHGEPELSAFWQDPEYGVLCKARFDWLNQESRIIVDLKSCTDASERKFTNDAYAHGYDMQSGKYCYGLTQITRVEHKDFYFIAVEKEPIIIDGEKSFAVQVYKATEMQINHGLTRCYQALKIYKECLDSGKWPAYPAQVKDINLPGWVLRKEGFGGLD